MRRRSPVTSFSNDSDYTGSNTNDGIKLDADLTDVNEFTDNNNENDEDEAQLFSNEDHPHKYYLQQLEIFNKQECAKEDYKDNSTRLLNRMEDQ